MRRASLIVLLGALPAMANEAVFEKHIRPLLVEHCQACHGPKKQMGGLRLDSREAMLKGGDGGPVVRPGDPDASRLVQAAGFRNRVVHGYEKLDMLRVHAVAKDGPADLRALLAALSRALQGS